MKKYKSRSKSRSRSRSKQKHKTSNNNRRDHQHHKSRDKYRDHRDRDHQDKDHKDRDHRDRDRDRDRNHKDKEKQRSRQKQRDRNKDRGRDRQHKQIKHTQDRQHMKNRKKHYSSQSSQSKSRSRSKSKSSFKNRSHSQDDSQNRYDLSQKSSQQRYHKKQQYQSTQPRFKIEQTKTLKIQNCTERQAAQRALTDASINAGTSVPDQVELRQGSIYVKYPSTQVSSAIKQLLKQKITIHNVEYRINFYPFKRIDLNIAYDWYCDKCDYKNFARRNKCYRCQNQKNPNCKFNYSSTSSSIIPVKAKTQNKQENINNCSLMVRGPVIMEVEQEVLLDLFQAYSAVKDIRMIRNKMTGQLKDFAFVQFFTPQQAAVALKQASSPDFRVKGQKVSVMYSRNKSEDEYSKLLPYQRKQRKKDFPGNPNKKDKKDQPVQSYYNRQRQLQIQQQKLRPIITLQQLKQKHEQQLKKKAANARQLTQQQTKRRQAQLLAKQWEKQAKMQNTILYICVICRRKFKNENEMKAHQINSELHKFNKQKIQLSL